jgi:hypothetical protein
MKHTPNGHIDTRELIGCKYQASIVKAYLRRVQAVTWNRVFLQATPPSTSTPLRGKDAEVLFGLGPPATQQGDIVVIFYGCSVLVILRRHAEGGTKSTYYKFTGEAYIYGKMDGEALYGPKEEKEFRLK